MQAATENEVMFEDKPWGTKGIGEISFQPFWRFTKQSYRDCQFPSNHVTAVARLARIGLVGPMALTTVTA